MTLFRILYINIFISLGLSAIINIPADFSTIQKGVDASVKGDTILVQQGIYNENILINKSITLTSLALFDTTTNTILNSLDSWYDYDFEIGQHMVTDTLINSTIIDGAQSENACITIISPVSQCIHPNISGFTIQNGTGANVIEITNGQNGPEEIIKFYGGGIFINNAFPSLNYNFIKDNGNINTSVGGGIYLGLNNSVNDSLILQGSNVCLDLEIDLANNFYRGNSTAGIGKTIASNYPDITINMSYSIFDYIDCQSATLPHPFWAYFSNNIEDINLTGYVKDHCLLSESIYVTPHGDDNNIGVLDSPFKTINHALTFAGASEDNNITIYLDGGTYSPSTTGEIFPLYLTSYINLVGQNSATVIIDAEQTEQVITVDHVENIEIQGMTIRGGISLRGGGVFINNSSEVDLTNVNIIDNKAEKNGGGMYLYRSTSILTDVTISDNECGNGGSQCDGGGMGISGSDPTLINVIISQNKAQNGGGLHLNGSNPNLTHVRIIENTAQAGGGMFLIGGFMPDWETKSVDFIIEDVIIANNHADWQGGGIFILGLETHLSNMIITENSSSRIGGGISVFMFTDYLFLSNISITHNMAEENGGGINIGVHREDEVIFSSDNRCNIYSNNISGTGLGRDDGPGTDIYAFWPKIVIVDTFSVIIPTNYYASPLENFTFDILNSILPESAQVDADLYVSPYGSNDNDGLTAENPLQTINYAQRIILADANQQRTIYLADGVYSPSSNNEIFPIPIIDYVSIIGESADGVVLDAQNLSRVMTGNGVDDATVSNMTLMHGYGGYGGGLHLSSSDIFLNNIILKENNANIWGGGIYLERSNPVLTDVTISDNVAGIGGGMYFYNSDPLISTMIIENNTAGDAGGGIYLGYSNPKLINITVSGNTAENSGGGMALKDSQPDIINSIIWNNNLDAIYIEEGASYQGNIAYSDVEGFDFGTCLPLENYPSDPTCGPLTQLDCMDYVSIGICSEWDVDGNNNINLDPLFSDPENGDYSLQEGSPCIDAGDPDLWYYDSNSTRADMGAMGGAAILSDFKEYDFGNVGMINGATIHWTLYNNSEMSIVVDSIRFLTAHFGSDISFPVSIESQNKIIIPIHCHPVSYGELSDSMFIHSEDIFGNVSVQLMARAEEGIIGRLSGKIIAGIYNVGADIYVEDNDTLIIEAGTTFQFAGEYEFSLNGILKAQGTKQDSIIFEGKNVPWNGFVLKNQTNESVFEYVRISGSHTIGMILYDSAPILTHMNISNNTTNYSGGGMYISDWSNPILTHVNISNNTAGDNGGGMYISHGSNPILTHVNISNNTAGENGGGMYISDWSNPTLTHLTISGNTAYFGGGMYIDWSNPTLTHLTISGNTASSGGGMYIRTGSNPTLTNSIIWNNSPQSIYISESFKLITISISYSNIEDGEAGIMISANDSLYWNEGNIDLDPFFTNPENGDFTLQTDSPSIDVGTAFFVWRGDTLVDMNENEYYNFAPDLGAYEYGFIYGCIDSEAENYNIDANIDDGSCEYLNIRETLLPLSYNLNPAYPNPFNPATIISFSIPDFGFTTITTYDIRGRQLTILTSQFLEPGYYSAKWNASQYPSGIYFIQMVSGQYIKTRKVMMVK